MPLRNKARFGVTGQRALRNPRILCEPVLKPSPSSALAARQIQSVFEHNPRYEMPEFLQTAASRSAGTTTSIETPHRPVNLNCRLPELENVLCTFALHFDAADRQVGPSIRLIFSSNLPFASEKRFVRIYSSREVEIEKPRICQSSFQVTGTYARSTSHAYSRSPMEEGFAS